VVPAAPAAAHVEGSPQVKTLFAGQDIPVGTVSVWNDGTNLYVKYQTTDDWVMTETHLHVATSEEDIPQTEAKGKSKGNDGGNPIPGHFTYGDCYDPAVTEDEFTIPLNGWGAGTSLYIAAHAVVQKCVVEQFEFVPELSWERSSEEAVAVFDGYGAQWTQLEGFNIPPDSETLVWDGGVPIDQCFTGYSTRSDINWASWECTENPTGKSTTGTDLRRFQATFDIPAGYSVTGGTLGSVNAGYEDVIPMNDNIYIFVNEGLIFWGGTISLPQLDPSRTHFLGMERRPTEPQNKAAFPETDGWHMDGTIPEISSDLFVEGENVLDVFAEELWTGGGMHELGLTLQVEQTTCETETAWGEGIDFPGKNWATYFTYEVQGVAAPLYNSRSFTCSGGASDTSGSTYGTVWFYTDTSGDLTAWVILEGATPDATYSIWVNQYPDDCPTTPTGSLTTDSDGNGITYVTEPLLSTTTSVWVSAVGGSQVLRSTAVIL